MKKLIILLLAGILFSACKKNTDAVKPIGTASEVLGTYALTSFMYRNGTDPDLIVPAMPVVQQGKTTYFGSVELTEVADPNQARMVLKLTLDGKAINDLDFETVDVEKSGSGYTLLSDGDTFATISGNTLSFDVQDNTFRMKFSARR